MTHISQPFMEIGFHLEMPEAQNKSQKNSRISGLALAEKSFSHFMGATPKLCSASVRFIAKKQICSFLLFGDEFKY